MTEEFSVAGPQRLLTLLCFPVAALPGSGPGSKDEVVCLAVQLARGKPLPQQVPLSPPARCPGIVVRRVLRALACHLCAPSAATPLRRFRGSGRMGFLQVPVCPAFCRGRFFSERPSTYRQSTWRSLPKGLSLSWRGKGLIWHRAWF